MSAVAITALSAITPLGDTPDAIFAALASGTVAHAPDAEAAGVAIARIADFAADKYAKIRGMRMYNRTTQLAICATKLALAEAKIEIPVFPAEDVGVLMASTYGHLDVLVDYDRSLVVNGMMRTNGALMPFAISSAPGAMVALSFGAKALSMTFSDGRSSALDALGHGAHWVAEGRAKALIVVASFSAAPEIVRAIARAGSLSAKASVRPFDRQASGIGLGEGAVAFILERPEHAAARGAAVLGHVCGYSAAFARDRAALAPSIARAATGALRSAGATADRIALVSAGAAGEPTFDRAEAEALGMVLGDRASKVPLTAVHGALGDTVDASGALQSLVAVSALQKRKVPPIAGLEEPLVAGLRYARKEEAVDAGLALVTSATEDGSCSALLLSTGP